jgi:hypothetical protein
MLLPLYRGVITEHVNRNRGGRSSAWVCAVTVVLSGCAEVTTDRLRPDEVPGVATYESAIRTGLPAGPIDHRQLFRATGEIEPWFGGLYLENGELQVVTTDPTAGASRVSLVAEGLLRAAGRDDLAARSGTAHLVEGRYSFRQLDDWLSLVLPDLHRFGVHRVAIDERMNRIDLRTETDAAADGLSEWAHERGVPPSALVVQASGMAEFNYRVGGDGVVVQWGPGQDPWGCTLTQVVTRRNSDGSPHPDLYGITNSHCTSDMGNSDGNTFVVGGGTPVALEYWTHPFITNPLCEALTGSSTPMCRYSDASLFRYNSSATGLEPHMVKLGTVCIPPWGCGTYPPQQLDREDLVFVGETVNKYGDKTQLTYGPVLESCVDIQAKGHPSGQAPWLLCQYTADYVSDKGDSGAPVWVREPGPSGEDVRGFVGIHWGRFYPTNPEDPPGSYFSGVFHLAQEIVPDEPNWGTLCLSANSMFCMY